MNDSSEKELHGQYIYDRHIQYRESIYIIGGQRYVDEVSPSIIFALFT